MNVKEYIEKNRGTVSGGVVFFDQNTFYKFRSFT